MKQWQCPCGKWIDGAHLKHVHVTLRSPTLEEMLAARELGNDEQAMNQTVDVSEEIVWRPAYPRREPPQ